MRASLGRAIAAASVVGLSLGVSATARAELVEIGPDDDLQGAVSGLAAGDELVLRGGTYTLDFRLAITASGTAAEPVVVRSATGETAVITRDASQNVVNVENTERVLLRGLEIAGGSHGIRLSACSFVTVEDCHIHDTADVGISANVTGSAYEGLIIRHNDIHDTGGTGEGMYLGCNDGACVMFDSLIEGNHVHHTNGPGVSQGDGIEIKDGSYGNVVRDNVIHDTNYPCILVYGAGGNAVNVIERNAMWACGDHGIQAAADAVIRNNIILGLVGSNGIHSQTHQSAVPGNLQITHNTVVVDNTAVRIDAPDASILIANNALYSRSTAIYTAGDAAYYTVAGNVGTGSADTVAGGFDPSGDVATDFVDVDFAGSARNAFPAGGSPLIGAGEPAYVADDDFNGTPREGQADVGAYRNASTGNPGWLLDEEFKEPTASAGGASGTGGAFGASGAGGSGGSTSGGEGGESAATGGSAAAGAGGVGDVAGATGTAGADADSGRGGGGGAPDDGDVAVASGDDDGGCGCRTARSDGPRAASWALAVLLVGAAGRRRRSRC